MAAQPASAGGGAPATTSAAPRVVVGSKNFPEHLILGELYAQALRARGFRVALHANIGTTLLIDKALVGGQISMYPEYTGRICGVLAGLDTRRRTARTNYDAAQKWENARGNTLLEPSAFQSRECVVVNKDFAQEHDLSTIADLGKLDHFVYGGPPELASRYQGAEGLRQTYGLHNFTFRSMLVNSTYAKLAGHGVDAIAGVTSDAELAGGDYAVLADVKGIFDADQVAPAVRTSLLSTMPPQFATTLNEVTGLLTAEVMITLNAETELAHKNPGAVATAFLHDNGIEA